MTSASDCISVSTESSPASRRQPWKIIGFIASVAIFSMQGAQAQETKPGWYAGINGGVSHTTQSSGDIDDTLARQGVTASSNLDRRDDTYSLNLGYQFNRNFAVEGGYVDLGKYKFNSDVAGGSASGDYRSKGWTASAIGILPLDKAFSAYGKVGAVFADTSFNANSSAAGIDDSSKSSTRPLYGLGLSYDFSKNVVGKAEWTRYDGLGNSDTGKADIDTYTVGVAYRF